MGTPHFAVASLKALHESKHEVLAVVTAPDKPAGRGKQLRISAVKEFARANQIAVLQPTNLKDLEFHQQLQAYGAELFVVVAFRMLPRAVWSIPAKGTINLHASLLPDYRGAAPINWAIINGETKSGVTTFFINENIDTGALIYQEEIPINPSENAGHLHDKLMRVGAELLVKTVTDIETGKASSTPQQAQEPFKHAPKIFREDLKLNFEKPAREVYNRIRGMAPYLAAFAVLKNGDEEINLKIYEAQLVDTDAEESPGSLQTDDKTYVEIACGKGKIRLIEVQLAGKKRMNIKDLLNGVNLQDNAQML